MKRTLDDPANKANERPRQRHNEVLEVSALDFLHRPCFPSKSGLRHRPFERYVRSTLYTNATAVSVLSPTRASAFWKATTD